MRVRFIGVILAAYWFVFLAGTVFAAENSELKTEISHSLDGTVLISKVTLGDRAVATDPRVDWPVITIANIATGEITYRIESGFIRLDVGQTQMRRRFEPGTKFHVSSVDLKDDRLELKLKSESGGSAKLRLVLGQGWQSNSSVNTVVAQLARAFDISNAPVSSSSVAASAPTAIQQQAHSATYARSPTAPNISERISVEDFNAVLAGLDSEYREALTPAMQDAQTIAKALLAFKNVYRDGRAQGVTALQDRLGKNLQPHNSDDITALSQVYLQCVRASQFGQTRDEYGHLLGAGGNNADFRSLLLDKAAASRLYENTQHAIQSGVETQAAIARLKQQMLSVESALDADNLQSSFDGFRSLARAPSATASVRRYLELTAQLRNDLSDYAAVKNAARPSSMSLNEELDLIVQEHRRLTSVSSEPLTSGLLKSTLAADRGDLTKRIAALPTIALDATSYAFPQQLGTTTPSNAEAKETFLREKLSDVDATLSSVAVIREFLGQPSRLNALDEECGKPARTALETKGEGIAQADAIRKTLTASLTAVQSQIQEYRLKAEAEAEAQRRKEARASAEREASAIQFRGLRAEMSQNAVRALLVHAGDSLDCERPRNGDVTCNLRMGNAFGTLTFSGGETLTAYEIRLSQTSSDEDAPKQAFYELVAQMGPGKYSNIFADSPSFLARTAGSEYEWGTTTTVPCLLDTKQRCPSVELIANYSAENRINISISLWDWGYQARKEGLKTPDPNAPHPTFQGELSLFGLYGGEPKSAVLNLLGKNNDTGCHFDQNDYTTKCTVTRGSTQWSVTFYENTLQSYRVTFPANDWSQQIALVKAALRSEPTEIESRTSGVFLSWSSTAKIECVAAPGTMCPKETFILNKDAGENTGTGIYIYGPMMSKEISDSVKRAMSNSR